MVHDAQVARYDFVLQHGAGWDVDPVSVVSDDDDGALGGRGDTTVSLKSGLNCRTKADSNISSRRSGSLGRLQIVVSSVDTQKVSQ